MVLAREYSKPLTAGEAASRVRVRNDARLQRRHVLRECTTPSPSLGLNELATMLFAQFLHAFLGSGPLGVLSFFGSLSGGPVAPFPILCLGALDCLGMASFCRCKRLDRFTAFVPESFLVRPLNGRDGRLSVVEVCRGQLRLLLRSCCYSLGEVKVHQRL